MAIMRAQYICRQCRRNLLKSIRPGFSYRRHRNDARNASTAAGQVAAQSLEDRPFRLGIIGSGPAGFYAAARVMQKMQNAIIDMYEQLPAPFGLVRYGVAPDHPEVKNCQERFEEVAASPRFNFIGNIRIGEDVSLHSLKKHYDALLFSYGASQDRTLGIPGEDLKGVYSARAFVGWYNGLPEYDDLQPDLECSETAVIIGNGNVALDVARILLSPFDALKTTDISGKAVDSLSKSRVKDVIVCGRRGPMQAAFTIKEVRELMKLPSVGFKLNDPELVPGNDFISSLPKLEQRRYRIAKVMAEGSNTDWAEAQKNWSMQPLLSPIAFEADPENDPNQLHTVKFDKTQYEDYSQRFFPTATVKSTQAKTSIRAGLAFRSIGYKSRALPELDSALGIQFDDKRGVIPNDLHGRVMRNLPAPVEAAALQVPGCYCAGWVKRGPTGVIASTMDDAFATADIIVRDWEDQVKFLNGSTKSIQNGSGLGWEGVLQEERESSKNLPRRVTWRDWQKVDAAEIELGKKKGKVREKFRSTDEMLKVLD